MLAGALGGAGAAVLVVWALGAHPGRSQGDLDALRTDLAVVQGRLDALAARLPESVSRVEAALRAHESASAATSVSGVEAELRQLRDAVRLELETVDMELHRLGDLMLEGAEGGRGRAAGTPLDEEEEPRWVVLSGDPDPGVRFSALALLGRRRSDRSVQASLAGLDDEEPMVAWQACRNLGGFGERVAAGRIVALLDHDAAVVRSAAHDALLRMGAPAETGFDAGARVGSHEDAIAALRAWAEEAE